MGSAVIQKKSVFSSNYEISVRKLQTSDKNTKTFNEKMSCKKLI